MQETHKIKIFALQDFNILETFYRDISQDVTLEFIVRVRLHDDEVSVTLKGHLLVEYLINKIIEQRHETPEKVLGKSHNFTFSKKLQLVYSMGLLPDYLFENINRINRLRNKLAHNLTFDLDKEDMSFTKTNGETINIYPKKSRYPERRYLKMLCFSTLSQLERHMEYKLKLNPRFIESSKAKK